MLRHRGFACEVFRMGLIAEVFSINSLVRVFLFRNAACIEFDETLQPRRERKTTSCLTARVNSSYHCCITYHWGEILGYCVS